MDAGSNVNQRKFTTFTGDLFNNAVTDCVPPAEQNYGLLRK